MSGQIFWPHHGSTDEAVRWTKKLIEKRGANYLLVRKLWYNREGDNSPGEIKVELHVNSEILIYMTLCFGGN